MFHAQETHAADADMYMPETSVTLNRLQREIHNEIVGRKTNMYICT